VRSTDAQSCCRAAAGPRHRERPILVPGRVSEDAQEKLEQENRR
jgi:hypothetical protein